MKNKIVVIVCVIFFAANCRADTVYTNDNKEFKGVVMDNGADKIQLWTKEGDKVINRTDINKVVFDGEEDNILAMADDARAKKDFIRGFYLYQKVFRLNPDSKRAVEGMTALQGYLTKNSEADAMVTYNQRYGDTKTPMMDDKEALAKNAAQTERVARELGMMLGSSDNLTYYRKIKILDSIKDSRSDRAGIQIDDALVGVEGKPTDYIGLFAAVDILVDKIKGPVRVTIERERSVWLNNEAGLGNNSLMDRAGFSIDKTSRGFVVSRVRQGSLAEQAGLKEGDLIVKLNDVSTRQMGLDDFLNNVEKNGPSYIDIVIQRDVTL